MLRSFKPMVKLATMMASTCWARLFVAVALVLLYLWAPTSAQAHARATSFSYWQEGPTGTTMRLVFPWIEVQQAFPELRGKAPADVLVDAVRVGSLRRFFEQSIVVMAAGNRLCPWLAWWGPRLIDQGLEFGGHTSCGEPVERLRFDLTFHAAPSHVHLFRYATQGRLLSGVAGAEAREFSPRLPEAGKGGRGWHDLLAMGFAHILAGSDHLLFLTALALLASSLRLLLWLATGFTGAHSIALVLATLGLAKPHEATIEALIGFTVAFAGVEAFLYLAAEMGDALLGCWLRRGAILVGVGALVAAGFAGAKLSLVALFGVVSFQFCYLLLANGRARWRWLIVFLFGFVHGFGFAGPLLALELPRTELAWALGAFNGGVELGQIAFLLVLWPVLRLSVVRARMSWVRPALAAGVLAAGIQWFLVRAFA